MKTDSVQQAKAILIRNGLNVKQWGFLINDIAEAIEGRKFYVNDNIILATADDINRSSETERAPQ